ncbi:DUF2158 domain-containing protein [Chryseobacterium sp. JJR-5R]|uniref:DUF2158 domain-containing protein n=1 Tax=Chryseobacterium sp. JJR-5R TaxID=3093923 RepID=UPI002A766A34|nr:DUF2158 domain-containing protein [Chryseobacterium sp. JJR-5R]WPO81850.1 DUF2158 domain-containing protein [Chryseobacterium sp. JJR-5R]
MAKTNFQVGDIVTLKSGSPRMTISQIMTREQYFGGGSGELEFNKIKVNWFVGTEVKSGEFIEPQLEKYDNSNEPGFSKNN